MLVSRSMRTLPPRVGNKASIGARTPIAMALAHSEERNDI